MPSLKRLLNLLFVVLALAMLGGVVRHFERTGWPIHHANVALVVAAGVVMLAAYVAKAWGWQRLFSSGERPAMLTLAAAGGAAAMGGIALPGRFDDVVRIAVVRRCRRRRAGIGAVGLSLVVLALLDSAALAPLASVAFAVAHVGGWMRIGLVIVAVAGVLAAGLVFALPRLSRLGFVSRFRAGRWLGAHSTSPRDAALAWGAIALSWTLRCVAVAVLLSALGFGTDFALALAFVCAASASAVLPVAPAGAAMQAGAGAAILVAAGIRADDAVAFGVAAQALMMAGGAVFVLALGAWHAQGRLQQIAVAWQLRRVRTAG